MRNLLSDIRYAFRLLFKSPGFTTTAVITLALGIGVNTAIFSVVNAVLLRPLPYAEPDRLLAFERNQSLPDVLDVARESKTLQYIGTFGDFNLDMLEAGEPARVNAAVVGGDLFPAFAVQPEMGGYFTNEDSVAKRTVVVVSHRFWQRALNGRSDVVGSSLTLSGVPYTVIGVMPQSFKLPRGKSEAWVPFGTGYPDAVNARGAHFTYAIGRLRDGVTLQQARSEVAAIGAALAKLHPDEPANMNVVGLHEKVAANLRSPVLILLAAVAMVLLIACANYANLLLAKVAGRTHEMSVRAALGATRMRLVQQLVTESTVLSLLGGGAGLLLASVVNLSLLMLKPESMVLFHAVLLDRTALLFAFAVSVLTGLIFGLAPAVSVWRTKAELKSSGAAVTVHSPLRRLLVVAELAVSIVLLVGAGLLIRSFWQVTKQDTGFEPARVLTMRYALPVPKYTEIPPQQQFIAKVDEALRHIPGVESGGIVTELPLDGSRMQHNMIIQGHEDVKTGEEPEIETHEITRDYFTTVGIRLLHGRVFNENDGAGKPLVVIVNQTLAKQFWPGQDPIGKQVRWARMTPPQWMTVVGVAADTRDQSLEEDPQATVYTPTSQKLQPWKRWGAVVVRTHSENPMSVAAQVRKAVWSADQQLPLTDVETLETVLSESLGERRFNMTLLGSFAALALVLAVVGLYGVMSYVATQRTREVGIRMALGATSLDIVREFLTSAMGMIAIGGVLGTLGAMVAVRMMSTMLFQVQPMDVITFATVLTVLAGTALLATYIPARRAAKTDPAIALRHD